MANKAYQAKIVSIVNDYKRIFPSEYHAVVNIVRENRSNQRTKWAEADSDVVERALFEYPANLWNIFNTRLEPEELTWLTTKEGAHWFERTYQEFSLSGNINPDKITFT